MSRPPNSNWGTAPPLVPPLPAKTEFDRLVDRLRLSPRDYAKSAELRDWVQRNHRHRFVPEDLLETMRLI